MSNQEIIRRRQYCQIVKEITGSDKYLVVGIDVAKEKHHAFMGSATGKSLFRKLIFENNLDGFSRLLKTADEIKVQTAFAKSSMDWRRNFKYTSIDFFRANTICVICHRYNPYLVSFI